MQFKKLESVIVKKMDGSECSGRIAYHIEDNFYRVLHHAGRSGWIEGTFHESRIKSFNGELFAATNFNNNELNMNPLNS